MNMNELTEKMLVGLAPCLWPGQGVTTPPLPHVHGLPNFVIWLEPICTFVPTHFPSKSSRSLTIFFTIEFTSFKFEYEQIYLMKIGWIFILEYTFFF